MAEPGARTLVFLATYDEAANVGEVYRQLRQAVPDADLLFLDDDSPDGTGRILDELARADPHMHVIHRPGKLGIGSAHKDGIRWAYAKGYAHLITMDCDFAHSPEYVTRLLDVADDVALVTGTRFHSRDSLPGWHLHRRLLTHLGHFLTRTLLGLPFDATSAFRHYDLRLLPRGFLDLVVSDGYPFFFESLHVIRCNGFCIAEVPIRLPARTYGSSKMRLRDVFGGFLFLLRHAAKARLRKTRLRLPTAPDNTPAAWDAYWTAKDGGRAARLYDRIAAFYRSRIIKPSLDRLLDRYFEPGQKVLHAGCGSGMVDADVVRRFRVTACDFSPRALETYRRLHGDRATVVRADLFATGFGSETFDGLYNLGVMEHFTADETDRVLGEFHRILRPGGRMVLFWPPEFGLSVVVLKVVHFVLNDLLGRDIHLHPAEPSRVRSRRQVGELLRRHGFALEGFHFGPRDLFTHSVIAARRMDGTNGTTGG